MDSNIKVYGLPKDYYQKRFAEVVSDYNKIKINYENTLNKWMYAKKEIDHAWEIIKDQQEYITNLEERMKELENRLGGIDE